jgi:hypothetical protein
LHQAEVAQKLESARLLVNGPRQVPLARIVVAGAGKDEAQEVMDPGGAGSLGQTRLKDFPRLGQSAGPQKPRTQP